MRALTPDQVRQVLTAAEGDPLEALYVLAIVTGMRQGELLALRWQDVDLQRGTLQVVATLEERAGQSPRLAETKTRRSRRQVTLSATAVHALGRHHSARRAQSALLPGAFVFTRPDGRPLSRTTLLYA